MAPMVMSAACVSEGQLDGYASLRARGPAPRTPVDVTALIEVIEVVLVHHCIEIAVAQVSGRGCERVEVAGGSHHRALDASLGRNVCECHPGPRSVEGVPKARWRRGVWIIIDVPAPLGPGGGDSAWVAPNA